MHACRYCPLARGACFPRVGARACRRRSATVGDAYAPHVWVCVGLGTPVCVQGVRLWVRETAWAQSCMPGRAANSEHSFGVTAAAHHPSPCCACLSAAACNSQAAALPRAGAASPAAPCSKPFPGNPRRLRGKVGGVCPPLSCPCM